MNNKYIKSPFNYIGGKQKLLSQILPLFPDNIDKFYDLFCGGCNVGINAHANYYVFNDTLTPLINCYQMIKEVPVDLLIREIKYHIYKRGLSQTNEEAFYKLREEYNITKNNFLFYLVVTYSYNNQIRFNSKGLFNNPFGKNRSSFNSSLENKLRGFKDFIDSHFCVFNNMRYDEFTSIYVTNKDFVYVDPPYLITKAVYNTGWDVEEEKRLYSYLDSLNKLHIRWALSNVLTYKEETNDILKNWINKYHTHYLNKDYSNTSAYTGKIKAEEVLVTNY